jgi:hypothetical protein
MFSRIRAVVQQIRDCSPFRHTYTEALLWNEDTDWNSWRTSNATCQLHFCWLSVERREKTFKWHSTTAVIGTRQGTVTILDFSDIIAMFKDLDQLSAI